MSKPQTIDTEVTQPRKRTLEERLRAVNAQVALRKDENLQDLILYRNATKIPQVIVTDLGHSITLQPRGYTDRSLNHAARDSNKPLVPFLGGTVIMTRQRGLELEARGILEVVQIVDKADPAEVE